MPADKRISQILTFLDKTPNDSFLNYALGIEYVGLGNDVEAQRIFEELIHKQPDYFATYYHLAKLYERKEEWVLAEKTYEKGLAITKQQKEDHAYRELKSALDELIM